MALHIYGDPVEHSSTLPSTPRDSPETTAESATNDRPTLLGLPSEIRKRILSYLLSTDLQDNRRTSYHSPIDHLDGDVTERDTIVQRNVATFSSPQEFFDHHSVFLGGYDLSPNVLWTCKQLLSEGSSFLTRENKFVALRYPKDAADLTTMIGRFMGRSGIQTAWVDPGVFKPFVSIESQAAVVIDVHISGLTPDDGTLVIVPFEDLGNLCQALSAYSIDISNQSIEMQADEDEDYGRWEDEKRGISEVDIYLEAEYHVNFCVSRIPGWKERGFASVVGDLEANLFDWIGSSVFRISCNGHKTGLNLERCLESWLRKQPTGISMICQKRNKKVVQHLVQRFREAEKKFLSNNWASACVSLVKLNALMAFSSMSRVWTNENTTGFLDLAKWTHFYLGLTLVEQAQSVRGMSNFQHRDKLLISASMYLPLPRLPNTPSNMTPAHRMRVAVAKTLATFDEVFGPARRQERRTNSTLIQQIMKRRQEANHGRETEQPRGAASATSTKSEKAKEVIKKSIFEMLPPLRPAKLKLE